MAKYPRLIGRAHTCYAKSDQPDVESLIADVASAAVVHAGMSPADVDAVSVGVFGAGFSRQSFEAAAARRFAPTISTTRRPLRRRSPVVGSAPAIWTCSTPSAISTLRGRPRTYISGGSDADPRDIEERRLTHPAVTEADLRVWLERHLARYKLPRCYVRWEQLPKSGYGKVVKRVIRDRLVEAGWTPEPSHAAAASAR